LSTPALRIQMPVILTIFKIPSEDLCSRCASHTQSNW